VCLVENCFNLQISFRSKGNHKIHDHEQNNWPKMGSTSANDQNHLANNSFDFPVDGANGREANSDVAESLVKESYDEMKGGLAGMGFLWGRLLAWTSGLNGRDPVNESAANIDSTASDAEVTESMRIPKYGIAVCGDSLSKATMIATITKESLMRTIGPGWGFMIFMASVAIFSWLGFSLRLPLLVWFILEFNQTASIVRKFLCSRYGDIFLDVDPAFEVRASAETVGWLNTLISEFWTSPLRNFVAGEGLRMLRGKLTESVLSLFKLDIGEKAPWITAIKVHDPVSGLACGQETLSVDMGLIFDLEPEIVCSIGNVLFFGIRKLHVSASLRFTLAPIFDENKVVGDLKVSLLTKPRLDFEFTGILGFANNILIKYPLQLSLRAASKLMHYPGFLVFPIKGGTPPKGLISAPPLAHGLIRVKVLRAEKINPKVTPLISMWLSRNRPFTLVNLNAENQDYEKFVMEFPLKGKDVTEGMLHVEALNEDMSRSVDGAGQPVPLMKLSVKRLQRRRMRKLAMKLSTCERSRLILFFQFIPVLGDKEAQTRKMPVMQNPLVSQAILSLFIYEVKSKEMLRPFISLIVAGGPASTTAGGSSNEICDFWEHFLFPVHNVATDQVTVSLMDERDGEGEKLGRPRHKRSRIQRVRFEKEVDESSADPVAFVPNYGKQYLLGRATVNMEYFTGKKQVLPLECPSHSCQHHVVLAGQIRYLASSSKNQISTVKKAL